jgi:hypothetical protein
MYTKTKLLAEVTFRTSFYATLASVIQIGIFEKIDPVVTIAIVVISVVGVLREAALSEAFISSDEN